MDELLGFQQSVAQLHMFSERKAAFCDFCVLLLQIPLEAYETGEEVRKLPCSHTYHRHPARASVASVNS